MTTAQKCPLCRGWIAPFPAVHAYHTPTFHKCACGDGFQHKRKSLTFDSAIWHLSKRDIFVPQLRGIMSSELVNTITIYRQ